VADLDDIKEHIAETEGASGRQAASVDGVREIVAQEVERFEAWRRSTRLAPLIQALRERGDRIQAAELARFAAGLSALSPEEHATVEALVRGVVAKLLHDPIVRLKEFSGPGAADAHARSLAELFGLPLPDQDPDA
jgi:glutamyl-tRNA reductase